MAFRAILRKRILDSFMGIIALLSLTLAWGCQPESSPNQGFCGIISPALETPLSYAVSLYLKQVPDEDFLKEETHRAVRRIPPVEVRNDPLALQSIGRGRCSFYAMEKDLMAEQTVKDRPALPLAASEGKEGAENHGRPKVFLLLLDTSALQQTSETGAEAKKRTEDYLLTLFSDEFQDRLGFYGLIPVSNGEREKARTIISETLNQKAAR